ncbi:MAG TPA: L,D-transpeptidase family protein [Gemmatimonadales bacterium]|nr:L,D-transpeptidase family protein [Gemmatimonadales bacterium]
MLVAAWFGSSAGQERVSAVDSLVARFYEERGGRLAWSTAGAVSPQARAVLGALARAGAEGLDPQDYPGAAIDSLLAPGFVPDRLSRLDSLLTRAFLSYSSDVSRGRVDPQAVDSLWRAAPHAGDLVRMLEAALDSGHVARVLRTLPPPQPGYAALRRALERYRASAAHGGWPIVRAGPLLEPGIRDARVALLRRRLLAEGYTAEAEGDADLFDGTLEAAVREFQERHGLGVDGSVGAATRRALNVPAADRVRQIALNLERWRWLPRFLGQRYIVVNSAAFTLDVVDGAQRVLDMRAIVGRKDWPTPIVSSRITEAVFRPAWHVPRAIATSELLRLVQRDRGYLTREGIRVFADSAAGGREIDPATIDWHAVTESTFTYQLVQEPGPTNPLGGVRFVFWTPFDVFIHDTPLRPLFTERFRTFSHGCVRVEGAVDLATYLLPEWSVDSIRAALTVGRERRVRVLTAIPVHLVYWTAWTDDRGEVQFRDDVYGWDRELGSVLDARPGSPALPPVAARPPDRACGR